MEELSLSILTFWNRYGYRDIPYELLKEIINKHLEYKTIVIVQQKDEIIGMVRFNIDKYEATVLDAVVRPDYRNKGVLKQLLRMGINNFPFLENIKWERAIKNDNKERNYRVKNKIGVSV